MVQCASTGSVNVVLCRRIYVFVTVADSTCMSLDLQQDAICVTVEMEEVWCIFSDEPERYGLCGRHKQRKGVCGGGKVLKGKGSFSFSPQSPLPLPFSLFPPTFLAHMIEVYKSHYF